MATNYYGEQMVLISTLISKASRDQTWTHFRTFRIFVDKYSTIFKWLFSSSSQKEKRTEKLEC